MTPPGLPEVARERGCEVEIGCGNGHFLSDYAAARPDTFLIGVDIKAKRCRKAREKADKRRLANVSIVHGSGEELLRSLPPHSVDAFHIYFPDPWPKSRHRKRRFFTAQNLEGMHDLLKNGGRIYFGTDFFDYYMQAKVLVALHRGFRLTEEPAPPAVLTSLYGQKYVGARKVIHLFSALRCGSAGGASADEEGQEDEYERHIEGDVQGDEQGRD